MVSWRDQNTNKLLESLQLENAELKEQLDCAILRIDKLQKEKQILEGQAYNVESRNRYNLDHINETKSLKQTVHSLEVFFLLENCLFFPGEAKRGRRRESQAFKR